MRRYCRGQRRGHPLSTGCSKTLVHADFVAEDTLNWDRTVELCWAHGNVQPDPTAKINIVVQDNLYTVPAVVSPNSPRPVLLGRDVGNLLELAVQSEAVFTRAQKRRNEKQDAIECVCQMVCQVKPKTLQEICLDDDQPRSTLQMETQQEAVECDIQLPENYFSLDDFFVTTSKCKKSNAPRKKRNVHFVARTLTRPTIPKQRQTPTSTSIRVVIVTHDPLLEILRNISTIARNSTTYK